MVISNVTNAAAPTQKQAMMHLGMVVFPVRSRGCGALQGGRAFMTIHARATPPVGLRKPDATCARVTGHPPVAERADH